MTNKVSCLSILLIMMVSAFCSQREGSSRPQSIPIIYSTDISHPHDDPDDHFDIVALYVLKELDILGIVLDQGKRQDHAPGRIPVEQMNSITGRNVPYAVGLSDPLKTPGDGAVDQDQKYQKGVQLILSALEGSTAPVMMITVGSLRDTAAAFNRRFDRIYSCFSSTISTRSRFNPAERGSFPTR